MQLADVYQVLDQPDTRIARGDEFTLASLAAEHIWAPCDSFVGKRIGELDKASRATLIFRRRIARDELQA